MLTLLHRGKLVRLWATALGVAKAMKELLGTHSPRRRETLLQILNAWYENTAVINMLFVTILIGDYLQVKEAKDMLARIDKKYIESVIAKQAALILLQRQTEFIENMMNEGLLTEKDVEIFFDKFREDESEIRLARREDFK